MHRRKSWRLPKRPAYCPAVRAGRQRLWSIIALVWKITGLLALAYLLLLARSAWKQGEIRQYLWSLAIIAGILAFITAALLFTVMVSNQ